MTLDSIGPNAFQLVKNKLIYFISCKPPRAPSGRVLRAGPEACCATAEIFEIH